MPQIVDVRAICLEPVRVSIAQLALLERQALAIGVSGEPGCTGAAPANGALCRVPAGDYLDLSSQRHFGYWVSLKFIISVACCRR
jgi:hypothetical protein